MGPRKNTNYIKDILHWAELIDAPIDRQAGDLRSIDSRPALRAAMVAREMGRFDEFHHRAYRARWSEARDVSDETVLGDLLSEAGLDARAAIERANSAEVDEQLSKQTQIAIDRGVFGVPTIFVGDEMFWGNDRFELVRFYVDKAD